MCPHHSRDSVTLTREQHDLLVERLLACAVMNDPARRMRIIGRLNKDIQVRVTHAAESLSHVDNIVRICAEHDGAVHSLLNAVYWYEGKTSAMSAADAVIGLPPRPRWPPGTISPARTNYVLYGALVIVGVVGLTVVVSRSITDHDPRPDPPPALDAAVVTTIDASSKPRSADSGRAAVEADLDTLRLSASTYPCTELDELEKKIDRFVRSSAKYAQDSFLDMGVNTLRDLARSRRKACSAHPPPSRSPRVRLRPKNPDAGRPLVPAQIDAGPPPRRCKPGTVKFEFALGELAQVWRCDKGPPKNATLVLGKWKWSIKVKTSRALEYRTCECESM